MTLGTISSLASLILAASVLQAGGFKLEAGPTGSKAEPRVPIVADKDLDVVKLSEPATLTKSNVKYVLTGDIEAPGTAFTIGGGVRDAILDLGGHVVTYNTEKQPAEGGNAYAGCVFGVLVKGRGIENIVIRNGTILQGKGGNAGSHAISMRGGRAIEICHLSSRVHGPSTSNISAGWGGPNGRVHDNYLENRSRTLKRGLFAPNGIVLSQTGAGWEIYSNTIIGGHRGIAVWANALKDHDSKCNIHHNRLSPRRVHGQKAPQGIMCFGSAGNHIHENEISTDDSRGINLQGRGSGRNNVHHNLIACRYSTKATRGNYVENRCYGYWERDGDGNRLHANVWIVDNDVTDDRTSNSIGIMATTTGGRLKSAQYTGNRIICRHRNPAVEVLGFVVKRSDKGVVVEGNEIVARTAGVRVWSGSKGVRVKGNALLRPPGAPADAPAVTGDNVEQCSVTDNVGASLTFGDAPAAPTGLVAIRRYEAVELRWAPSAEKDTVGYNVYCHGKRINPYPVGGRFYVHLDVKPDARQVYAVSAVGLSGRESAKSAPLVVAPQASPATAPAKETP